MNLYEKSLLTNIQIQHRSFDVTNTALLLMQNEARINKKNTKTEEAVLIRLNKICNVSQTFPLLVKITANKFYRLYRL